MEGSVCNAGHGMVKDLGVAACSRWCQMLAVLLFWETLLEPELSRRGPWAHRLAWSLCFWCRCGTCGSGLMDCRLCLLLQALGNVAETVGWIEHHAVHRRTRFLGTAGTRVWHQLQTSLCRTSWRELSQWSRSASRTSQVRQFTASLVHKSWRISLTVSSLFWNVLLNSALFM